jgi:hypothetical protein
LAVAYSPGQRDDDTHMEDSQKLNVHKYDQGQGADIASSDQRTNKESLNALLKEWIQTHPRVDARLEAFQQLEMSDQVSMLLPDSITFDSLPTMERTLDWDDRMTSASNEVQTNIRDMEEREEKRQRLERRDEECYDRSSDDSDDGFDDVYGGTTAAQTYSSNADEYCRYIDMLPYCHPMTLGFHAMFMVSLNDNHWCYCPCGTHMRKWRELVGLDRLCSTTSRCPAKTKFSPSGLLDHINSVNDPLHRYTGDYLKVLYRNYHGDGHRHIAFEKLNDPAYQATHKLLMKRVFEYVSHKTISLP